MKVVHTRLSVAANEYLTQRAAAGQAVKTVANTTYTLNQLLRVTGDINASALSHSHIDKWRAAHAWGPATYNRKLCQIRAFVVWLERRRYLDPGREVLYGYRTSRVPKRDRMRIPVSEWGRLLDCAPHPVERALVACGLYLMARPSELTSIRVGDLNMEEGTVSIYRHKTGRPDTMPICTELEVELRRWLDWYHANANVDAGCYLLPTRVRECKIRDPRTGLWVSLSPEGRVDPTRPLGKPSRNVQRVLALAGYTTRQEGGHTLRRSAARAYYEELVASGHDAALRQVQTMLDHSSAIVTEGYLGTTRDKAERDRSLRGRPMFGSVDGATGDPRV